MYKDYFGFIELPFSIVPNARYLFLSSRHREAMTHLQAGLGEGGGFAMLTGEVGTGKTTVSKAMLASLGDEIDAGLILNPTFSESDLLEAICDEFSIEYPEQASLKQLSHAISGYLYANYDKGKQTLLLIDEAQHLSAQVLEQLRLLTNLETDSQKLLKVLLIGQPELQAKLQTPELRQLAQRITGRYHLLPLTEGEIAQYIEFRMNTAGVQRQVFSKRSIRVIAQKTQGVPRLINLVCDKALQYAYYSNEKEITASQAEKACADILSFQAPGVFVPENKKRFSGIVVFGSVACVSLVASAIYYAPEIRALTEQQPEPVVEVVNVMETVAAPVVAPEPTPVPTVTPAPVLSIEQEIAGFATDNEITAIRTLYRLWGVNASILDASCNLEPSHPFFCDNRRSRGGIDDIRKMNRPVVLALESGTQPFYAVLYAVYDDKAELLSSTQRIRIPLNELSRIWAGEYTGLQPNEISRTLRAGDTGSSVLLLDSMLAKALGVPALETNRFDSEILMRVKSFQKWQGLVADGVVGKKTLKVLDLVSNDQAPKLITLNSESEEATQPEGKESLVVNLDYPQFTELKPIVRQVRERSVDKKEKVVASENNPVAETSELSDKPASQELELDTLDLSELSPELAKLVQNAFEEEDTFSPESSEPVQVVIPDKLTENLTKYKGKLPTLNLQTHMYASDTKRRWVKINDKELSEGEWLSDSIQLISISPRNIVIAFNEQQIEIPALYEWEQ